MIRFRHALLTIGIILLIHVLAINYGVYHAYIWFDVVMHFFGGYAIALLALAVYGWVGERVEIRPRVHSQGRITAILFQLTFVLGFVMIVGVGWEWYEFIFDQVAVTLVQKYGVTQMGLADTLNDLFNDSVGALVGWVIWRKNS